MKLPNPNITVGPLALRPFQTDDVGLIRSAANRIGKDVLGRTYSTWHESFESMDGWAWTATISDTPIGFAATEKFGEGLFILHSDIVDPKYQRQGVGTALVLVRLATLDETYASSVGLLSTNNSISFYQRFGFEADGHPIEDPLLGVTLNRMLLPFSAALSCSALETLESAGTSIEHEAR